IRDFHVTGVQTLLFRSSKRLVEEMGGEIGVESVWGEGATFWFTLKADVDDHGALTDTFRAFRQQPVALLEADEHARLGLYHMLRSEERSEGDEGGSRW